MLIPTQWIQSNMLGTYSETLGRPLTEPEMRVQRCLEQMPVPDWYQKYSRPPNILKNCVPFECRPASWRTYKSSNTPRKSTKKRSFRKSTKKSESESSRTSTADSGYQDACWSSGRSPKKNQESPCSSSGTESDSPRINEDIPTILNASGKSFRSPLNKSNSYPRMSRPRKIENINIVFSQPFPPQNDRLQLDEPATSSASKTVYTMTKNYDLQQRDAENSASQSTTTKKTHASFLVADVKPSGVTTRVQMFAGPPTSDSSSGSSDEEQPRRCAPSPNSRFFRSTKKSMALEKIVQTRRTEPSNLIQKIIEELNRINSSDNGGLLTEGTEPLTPEGQNFVKNMVNALEQSCYGSNEEEEEEDQQSTGSSDSELAKSTSISVKSYDLDSVDDNPTSPLPPLSSAGEYCSSSSSSSEDDYREEEEEEREYWIPCYRTFDMPRTSSQMSNCSNRSGNRSGHSSPGLSPIKRERGDIWGMTFNVKETKSSSRQLFRIDETGVGDSGYSDRSTSASSRTATLSSVRSSRGSSSPAYCSSSASSTPTMRASYESPNKLPLSRSGPYVMRSYFV